MTLNSTMAATDGNDTDYGPQLNVLTWLLISVSGLFLFTRLYLKNCQNRGLWWDDWILLASWIALTAAGGIIAFLIGVGYGKRRIPFANFQFFGLPVNILSTLMIISNLWGKTSFGVTLLRIPVRRMRICVWTILITLTLTLTTSVLFVWLECGFFKLPSNGCVPVDVSLMYNIFSCGKGASSANHAGGNELTWRPWPWAAYSAAMDIVLAFLPWKYLLSQQMSKKEKIGATVAMSMGVLYVPDFASLPTRTPSAAGSQADRGNVDEALERRRQLRQPPSRRFSAPMLVSVCQRSNRAAADTPGKGGSIPLVALGTAESAVCIMAASIPILRALSKGGFPGPVRLGAETGYPTAMTESGLYTNVNRSIQPRSVSLSLATQPPSPRPPRAARRDRRDRRGTAASNGTSALNSLDATLTAGSSTSSTDAVRHKSDDESSDEGNFEMTNYRNRPQSPVDFTRTGGV